MNGTHFNQANLTALTYLNGGKMGLDENETTFSIDGVALPVGESYPNEEGKLINNSAEIFIDNKPLSQIQFGKIFTLNNNPSIVKNISNYATANQMGHMEGTDWVNDMKQLIYTEKFPYLNLYNTTSIEMDPEVIFYFSPTPHTENPPDPPAISAYPLFFLTMVLVAMRISPFSALLTALVPDQNRGSLMSLTVALGQVGFGLGGALAGPFYANFGYASNAVIGAISVFGMGLMVWFLVPEPRAEEEHPA